MSMHHWCPWCDIYPMKRYPGSIAELQSKCVAAQLWNATPLQPLPTPFPCTSSQTHPSGLTHLFCSNARKVLQHASVCVCSLYPATHHLKIHHSFRNAISTNAIDTALPHLVVHVELIPSHTSFQIKPSFYNALSTNAINTVLSHLVGHVQLRHLALPLMQLLTQARNGLFKSLHGLLHLTLCDLLLQAGCLAERLHLVPQHGLQGVHVHGAELLVQLAPFRYEACNLSVRLCSPPAWTARCACLWSSDYGLACTTLLRDLHFCCEALVPLHGQGAWSPWFGFCTMLLL
eukprot:376804-Pelagomonas_calceolata.AAC.2